MPDSFRVTQAGKIADPTFESEMHSPEVQPPIRALVVDDVPGVIRTVIGHLNQHNGDVQCHGFDSAVQALQFFTRGQFDCVVSDLRMPDMAGDELWCEMVGTDPDISLIFISGEVDLRTAVRFMSHGAVSVLEKPLDPHELFDAVMKATQRTRRLRAERAALEELLRRYRELTEEELSVLDCMLEGLSNKATAHRLTMSERTVDRRRHSIFQKLQAESVIQLAAVVAQIRAHRDRDKP